ncbi:DUF3836 domain-containing protein [Parabacteroides sp. OttesenSCG-928-N08]|nr:DUF3836 domain-containing protein [Parabacteroides sp. OttesenSCG-928-N08]
MKAFTKSILVLVFVFVGSIAMQAVSPKNYLFDTKEENGKITSKVVFLEKEGLLNKEMRYEFVYNMDGKVSAKKAYRWNKTTENWDPIFLVSYNYSNEESIISNISMWDKKKKSFSLNNQEILIPVDNYDSIFS